MEKNLVEIVELVSLLSRIGNPEGTRILEIQKGREIFLQFLVYHTKQEAEESLKLANLSEQELSRVIIPQSGFTSRAEEVNAILTRAIAEGKKNGVNVIHTPLIASTHFNELFYGAIRKKVSLSCGCFYILRISSDGSVIHCPYIRKKFGNLLHTPLPQIWNSIEFKEFRRTLLSTNMLPTCVRCGRLKHRKQFL